MIYRHTCSGAVVLGSQLNLNYHSMFEISPGIFVQLSSGVVKVAGKTDREGRRWSRRTDPTPCPFPLLFTEGDFNRKPFRTDDQK